MFGVEEVNKITNKQKTSYAIPPKVKDIQLTNEFIKIRFRPNRDITGYSLCDETENVYHLFFTCNSVQNFWKEMWDWMKSKSVNLTSLTIETIKSHAFARNKNDLLKIILFYQENISYANAQKLDQILDIRKMIRGYLLNSLTQLIVSALLLYFHCLKAFH